MRHAVQTLSLSFAAAVLASCVTTTEGQSDVPDSRWVQATGSLEVELGRQAEALPWTHGRERVELIAWFAAVGEPAYDTLLGFLGDERPEVVATALAALGATGDARLVEELRTAEQDDWNTALKLESARARVRLGDWAVMPRLIDGLEAEDAFVRALCLQALEGATRETLGFEPHGDAVDREMGVKRWRSWWQRRQSDALLAGK